MVVILFLLLRKWYNRRTPFLNNKNNITTIRGKNLKKVLINKIISNKNIIEKLK